MKKLPDIKTLTDICIEEGERLGGEMHVSILHAADEPVYNIVFHPDNERRASVLRVPYDRFDVKRPDLYLRKLIRNVHQAVKP